MFGLSDYLSAKLLWGIALVVAAGAYGFWRGIHGKKMGDDDSE
jgi:hypothetical protein